MKLSSVAFLLVALMPLVWDAFSTAQANDGNEEIFLNDDEFAELALESEGLPVPSHAGIKNRFLAEEYKKPSTHIIRGQVTCNKYPRICHTKWSPGPDCCKKKCVNVMADRLNCGMCGLKCKQQEMCCKGKCVNILHDKKHCGSCSNRCKKGSVCSYGMCSYA
ncbi:hypothetical protein Ancab_004855 [Ancistrocladus abbreviatus]